MPAVQRQQKWETVERSALLCKVRHRTVISTHEVAPRVLEHSADSMIIHEHDIIGSQTPAVHGFCALTEVYPAVPCHASGVRQKQDPWSNKQ